jgi:hypothetical protein
LGVEGVQRLMNPIRSRGEIRIGHYRDASRPLDRRL